MLIVHHSRTHFIVALSTTLLSYGTSVFVHGSAVLIQYTYNGYGSVINTFN